MKSVWSLSEVSQPHNLPFFNNDCKVVQVKWSSSSFSFAFPFISWAEEVTNILSMKRVWCPWLEGAIMKFPAFFHSSLDSFLFSFSQIFLAFHDIPCIESDSRLLLPKQSLREKETTRNRIPFYVCLLLCIIIFNLPVFLQQMHCQRKPHEFVTADTHWRQNDCNFSKLIIFLFKCTLQLRPK